MKRTRWRERGLWALFAEEFWIDEEDIGED